MKMPSYQIALCQMDIRFGDPVLNQKKVRGFFEQAASLDKKPDIIIFPELWNTGYDLTRLDDIADPEGKQTKELLSELSRQHQVYTIGGSVAEKRETGTFNASFVFSPEGEIIHTYRKAHLFRLMEEEKYLLPGESLAGFTLDGMPALLQICYDIRFPEGIRSGALAGAEVLFVAAEWPHPRLAHWRQLLIARAIENQMYVVACNRAGTDPRNTFCGHSMIIDPWGEVIAEGEEEEAIVTGEIDRALVSEVRGRIPVFSDRRTDLYML
nr:carbon-nitrogen family hydrolase [Aneurinibacillus tyrosinisolvens]